MSETKDLNSTPTISNSEAAARTESGNPTQSDSPTRASRKLAFLEAFAITGNISKAAEVAGIHRQSHYDWLSDGEGGPAYKKAFDQAEEEFADRVRDMVRRRAIDGVPEPIVWQGTIIKDNETQEVVTILKRSDRILELLAKAKCAEFKEKVELEAGASLGEILARSYGQKHAQ
jgi:hypothetical protein